MKVIKPSYSLVAWSPDLIKVIEESARICYLSESVGSVEDFIRDKIKKGHESVLEHGAITVDIICDRGVSHELVRHRVASFSQESSRYCNYSKDKFGNELTFIEPPFFDEDEDKAGSVVHMSGKEAEANRYEIWRASLYYAECCYLELLRIGATPQEARSVLPNSLKTKIRITANPREWRHIFQLRCDKAAHPQMREIMLPLHKEFSDRWPCLFDDITY